MMTEYDWRSRSVICTISEVGRIGCAALRMMAGRNAHQTFTDTEVLDRAIHNAVDALNVERNANPLANQRISA